MPKEGTVNLRSAANESQHIWIINSCRRLRSRNPKPLKLQQDYSTSHNFQLTWQCLQDSATQLVQAQKMEAVGQITCGMAHDFNNVLQGVGSCLAALEEHIADEKGRQLLATAQQGIERGMWLTRCLLTFARHQALPPQPTRMTTIVQGVRAVLECSMGALIGIETDIADDVWLGLVDP